MVPEFISVHGEQVGGLKRHISFPDASKAMLAYYVVGFFWLLELTNSMSQFVISYSVVLWYYTAKPKGYGPHIPLIRGIIVGTIFHLGTLALGSFLIALCRPLRVVLGSIMGQVRSGENPVCEKIAQCCDTALACYQQYVEFISRSAYIDVCISSSSFGAAARDSFGFIATEGGTVMALTGSCFIYCLAGILSIATLCSGFTYAVLVSNQAWTSESSPHHVGNPLFVTVVSALLAGIVAACFCAVIDHTADTLLYAYVWNKSHGHNTVQKYAPDTLAKLTEYKPISRTSRRHLESRRESGGGRGNVFQAALGTLFSGGGSSPGGRRGGLANSEETASLMESPKHGL
jgi:hypothetical protein